MLIAHGAKAPIYMYMESLVSGAGPPLLGTTNALLRKKLTKAERNRPAGAPATGFYKLSLEQIVPFLTANPHIHSIILDGEKTHPGLGVHCSAAVNYLWQTHPLLKQIKLIRGPSLWDKKGVLLSTLTATHKTKGVVGPHTDNRTQLQHAIRLAGNKEPNVDHCDTWPANSPDLNPAEHIISGIKLPSNWVEGSYTEAQLKSTILDQYAHYAQEWIDRAMASMPRRMQAVIDKNGYMLDHADYKVKS